MEQYKLTDVKKGRNGISLTFESVEYGDVRKLMLSEKLWDSLPFGKGDILTSGEVDEVENMTLTLRAFENTKIMLSYSGQSRGGLQRKLCLKGYSKEIAEAAVQMAEENGLLDEKREAYNKAEYCLRHKKWGKRRIVSDLIAKGYSKAAVSEAVDALDEDLFFENLISVIEGKAVPVDKNGRRKYIASLCRMGYTTGEVISAIKEVAGREK